MHGNSVAKVASEISSATRACVVYDQAYAKNSVRRYVDAANSQGRLASVCQQVFFQYKPKFIVEQQCSPP